MPKAAGPPVVTVPEFLISTAPPEPRRQAQEPRQPHDDGRHRGRLAQADERRRRHERDGGVAQDNLAVVQVHGHLAPAGGDDPEPVGVLEHHVTAGERHVAHLDVDEGGEALAQGHVHPHAGRDVHEEIGGRRAARRRAAAAAALLEERVRA